MKSYYSNIDSEDSEERMKLFMADESVVVLLEYIELTDDEKKAIVSKNNSRDAFNSEWSAKRLLYAFENSRDWLKHFVDFNKFVEYFALNDLVRDDGNIKALAPWFPVLPDGYKNYMGNSIKFILARKDRLIKRAHLTD